MNKTLVICLLSTALLLPLTAHASTGDCDSKGTPALGEVEIGAGDASATFYVDDRNYVLGNGLWLYQESNGIFTGGSTLAPNPTGDLQRGGSSIYVPDDNEICVDDPNVQPDQLIL
jgi:hypothetical protein